MTDIQTTETPTTTAADPAGTETQPPRSNEAAKYRIQLREAEAQLEKLTGQRDQFARAMIDSKLPDHVKPRAFWRLNEDVSQFLDADTGELNLEAVSTAAEQLAEDFGLERAPTAPVIPGQAMMDGAQRSGPNLEDAFSPKLQNMIQ